MSPHLHLPKPPDLEEIKRRRKPLRDVNAEHQEALSRLERMAIFISDHVGTPGFFF